MIKISKKTKESLIVVTVIALIIGGSLGFIFLSNETFSYDVKTFSSYNELLSFLESKYQKYNSYNYLFNGREMLPRIMLPDSQTAKTGANPR